MLQQVRVSTRARRPLADVLDRVLARGVVIAPDARDAAGSPYVIQMRGHGVAATLEPHTGMTESTPPDTESSPALFSAADAYLRRLPSGNAPRLTG